jgi:hydrogenase maturation factor
MDQCRVSWGKGVGHGGTELIIERRPLTLVDGRLALAGTEQFRALRQVDGKGFIEEVEAGDWVTIHWSWVCEVISEQQRQALMRYTDHHITLANQTI